MEFKSISEAIDQIAILQKKAQDFQASDELKKDMKESLDALEKFVVSSNTHQEAQLASTSKQIPTLSNEEYFDYLILKSVNERITRANQGIEKFSQKDLLSFVVKDNLKLKALTTTTTMTDWIPTEFQNKVIDLITANIVVIPDFLQNVFRWSNGSNKRDYPYIDWYAETFTGVEGQTITESNPQDLKFNLTAKPFKGMYKWTDETDMFTVVEMLPLLRQALYLGLSAAIENSLINGDTAIAPPDVRSFWMGFRKIALDASLSADLSTFNITNFRALRQKLAKWGIKPSDLLIVAEENIAYYNFLNDANFLTIDKVGAKATVLTGQIGIYDGIPVKTSSLYPLTNATGQVDAVPANNTKGSFIIINKRPFAVGFYGNPIVEWDKDITAGINYLVLRQYFAFNNVYAQGVAVGYNMA